MLLAGNQGNKDNLLVLVSLLSQISSCNTCQAKCTHSESISTHLEVNPRQKKPFENKGEVDWNKQPQNDLTGLLENYVEERFRNNEDRGKNVLICNHHQKSNYLHCVRLLSSFQCEAKNCIVSIVYCNYSKSFTLCLMPSKLVYCPKLKFFFIFLFRKLCFELAVYFYFWMFKAEKYI